MKSIVLVISATSSDARTVKNTIADERISLEYNNTIDPIDVAKQYFKNHPQEDTKKQHQQVPTDVTDSYKTKPQMVLHTKSKDRNSYRHKGSTREMGEEYTVRDKTRNGASHVCKHVKCRLQIKVSLLVRSKFCHATQ